MGGCGCDQGLCSPSGTEAGRHPGSDGLPPDEGYRRVLWAVLAINALMFLVEGVGGLVARSSSLQGDALDFLGDAANYGIALYVLAKPLRWRAGAALLKGASMALFGAFVLGFTVWRAFIQVVPDSGLMGSVGLAALIANLTAAVLLFRHRAGDANRRSVWVCTRNDALANIAVLAAAGLVAVAGHGWPDWLVGLAIAGLALQGGIAILRQARGEWQRSAAVS